MNYQSWDLSKRIDDVGFILNGNGFEKIRSDLYFAKQSIDDTTPEKLEPTIAHLRHAYSLLTYKLTEQEERKISFFKKVKVYVCKNKTIIYAAQFLIAGTIYKLYKSLNQPDYASIWLKHAENNYNDFCHMFSCEYYNVEDSSRFINSSQCDRLCSVSRQYVEYHTVRCDIKEGEDEYGFGIYKESYEDEYSITESGINYCKESLESINKLYKILKA